MKCKVKKIRRQPGFDPITFTFSDNSNYGQERCIKANHCQQTFEYKKFVDNAQQCFAFMPQANFPADNLNFHLKVMGSNPGYLMKFSLLYLNSLKLLNKISTDLPEIPCNHLKSATTPMIPTLRRTFLLQHIHTTSYKREVYDTDSAQFSLV